MPKISTLDLFTVANLPYMNTTDVKIEVSHFLIEATGATVSFLLTGLSSFTSNQNSIFPLTL